MNSILTAGWVVLHVPPGFFVSYSRLGSEKRGVGVLRQKRTYPSFCLVSESSLECRSKALPAEPYLRIYYVCQSVLFTIICIRAIRRKHPKPLRRYLHLAGFVLYGCLLFCAPFCQFTRFKGVFFILSLALTRQMAETPENQGVATICRVT